MNYVMNFSTKTEDIQDGENLFKALITFSLKISTD